ncbi:MAG TPA: cation transporter, partial [Longimicrobiaceae bacterium]
MATNTKVIDPACGMAVDPASAAGTSEYRGETYHFCSAGCKHAFDADPAKYTGGPSGALGDQEPHDRPKPQPKPAPAATHPVVQLAMGAPKRKAAPAADEGAAERIDLPITGMHCAACARRIEVNLGRAPGVRRAGVNFATSRATVEYDPERTGVGELIGVVKDVGYGTAGTARADFVVDDSARPSGSSQPLQKHLQRVRGVVSADFNLSTMEVRVEYLPGATDVRTLRDAVESFGYRVRDLPGGAGHAAEAEDSLEAAHAAEYRELRRKFWLAAVLALPVLVMAMSHGRIPWLDFPGAVWVQLALTTPVVLFCGAQFFRGAWAAFRHRAADMNTLIAVGTGTAYLYSVAATFFPRFFITPHAGMGEMGMRPPVYYEAAAVITALLLMGRMLESRAKGRTGDAIRRL